MKINYPKVAEHLGVPLRGDETFTELLEIEKQVKEHKERRNNMKPQTKKVLKVLLRKARGLDRVRKIEEMERGLFALNLIVMRQKRDQGLSYCSYETIDFIDDLLNRAKQSRLNPRVVFKQLEFNY